MARLTFPDQQQDLQNAAGFSVGGECDGSVKFPRRAVKADSAAIRLPDGVWVGWSVSEVQVAFVTTSNGGAQSFPLRQGQPGHPKIV